MKYRLYKSGFSSKDEYFSHPEDVHPNNTINTGKTRMTNVYGQDKNVQLIIFTMIIIYNFCTKKRLKK